MDASAFFRSLDGAAPPEGLAPPLEALWWAHARNWEKAHGTVAGASGSDAARVHAYVHRWEGDLDNARYWYRRAGRELPALSLEDEWRALVDDLTAASHPGIP